MPFIDGCQLAERIKAQHCGTRVIIMTGHCEEDVTNKLNRSGVADGFLFKPFNLNTLKKKINACAYSKDGSIRHANQLGG
jgi:FixJ family two-component response regulator